MKRIRIIPVLLLYNGGFYKTTRFKSPVYIGDPINTVKIFNEKEADELVILNYSASLQRTSIPFDKIGEIASEAFMPMAYGGGIRNYDDAKRVFDSGFEKVVMNSVLPDNLKLVDQIAATYGAQAVVGSIDIKKNLFGKYKCFSHSGTKSLPHAPEDWAKSIESAGAGELLLNNIDRDGTWQGYDLPIIQKISGVVSIPLIACGGAGNLAHLRDAVNSGASAVAASSMFVYQKKGKGVLISFPSEGLEM